MPNLTTYPAYDDRGFPIELKQWEEKQDIKAVVELAWKSFSCKVRNPKPKVNRRGKKGNKRRLHGFSMQSSKYLKKIMSMIARGDTPYLLTLTMPQIVDSKRFKRYLQNFADFFRRKYPCYAVIWKLEFQKRGAAHFHLLIWGHDDPMLPRLDERDLDEFKYAWLSIIDDGVDIFQWHYILEHGVHLFDPATAEGEARVKNYLLYVTGKNESHHLKRDQIRDDIHTGRYWGIWRKKLLNISVLATGELSIRQLAQFRRYMRKHHRAVAKQMGFIKSKGTQALQQYLRRLIPGSFDGYLPFGQTQRALRFLGVTC